MKEKENISEEMRDAWEIQMEGVDRPKGRLMNFLEVRADRFR